MTNDKFKIRETKNQSTVTRVIKSGYWLLVTGYFLIGFLFFTPASAKILYNLPNPKQIALTFDDGPAPGFTDKILKILDDHNLKATFFVVGNKVKENPDLLTQIQISGHALGNHTYYHSRLDWINDHKILRELNMTSHIISKTLDGKNTKLFRPPYGKLTKLKTQLIQKAGYDIVLWSVNADDFYHRGFGVRKPDSIIRRVISKVKGGDIVLMHDHCQETIEALPEIIKILKNKGYSFIALVP